MALALTFTHETGYLLATVTGRFELESARQIFLEMLNVIARDGVERVLVDAREVTGKMRMADRFVYGEFTADAVSRMTKLVAMRSPRFAYVARPPILDPRRLAQNVARQRGMNVTAFDDYDEALQWLLQQGDENVTGR